MDAEIPDSSLLEQFRLRPEVVALLYRRHVGAVYRYLARRVGVSAADDLLSEVFAAALTARERVEPHPSGSALPWLYGIAGNVVRMHLRRPPPSAPVDDVSTVDWDAVDARLDAMARREELAAALAVLTNSEREVLLLVAWEGLSPAEAGQALGLTPVAARSRLHRARTRAQAVLDAPIGAPILEETP